MAFAIMGSLALSASTLGGKNLVLWIGLFQRLAGIAQRRVMIIGIPAYGLLTLGALVGITWGGSCLYYRYTFRIYT